ncbi:hypothetical protein RBU00_25515 [Rhizobium sp. AN63]|uniref:hypothetical protein n=1 Tax=unclassified Rhizobium TaxID=2613769 RepID=UPI0027D3C630|nr:MULTISPECIES: hypothetical protein [unclassified Rhizobium]MDQ4409088.1 hypothetical protein [Rhizobium sp. AN63]
MRDVHIRVVSPIVTRGFRKLADLKALEYPGIRLSHAEIATGPGSIESEFEAAMSVPGTLLEIARAEREGVDAVIIDCMGDPGLRPAGRFPAWSFSGHVKPACMLLPCWRTSFPSSLSCAA